MIAATKTLTPKYILEKILRDTPEEYRNVIGRTFLDVSVLRHMKGNLKNLFARRTDLLDILFSDTDICKQYGHEVVANVFHVCLNNPSRDVEETFNEVKGWYNQFGIQEESRICELGGREIMSLLASLSGWVGMVLVVLAYYWNVTGRLTATNILYHCLNVTASILLGANAFYHKAWPVFVLQVVWGYIAFHGAFKTKISERVSAK